MPGSRAWLVRPQDLVWLSLFGALALAAPYRTSYELELLTALALFQVLEPRIGFFSTPRGNYTSIGIKLLLGFLLIGFTGGVTSSYHLILLLPVVSAATTLGLAGTMAVTLLACASYLLFVHPFFLDPARYELTREGMRILGLRVIFLPVVGFLTNQLAEANRMEAQRSQATAEKLAEANRHLQEAEAAMRRSERMAALGQLSAGLAHELRNPLGTVKAAAEMLAKTIPAENAVGRELAGLITSEVDRVNTLVARFLDFARPLKLQLEENDLGETLERAVARLERVHPPFPVMFYRNFSPDIRPFRFDKELIEQVAYNLLLNAVEASPPQAPITIKTRPADNWAEFSVIDRGQGIDPAIRESIFNPFFTTKPGGVGLGLALVAKIVGEHGGKISVESEPGAGSVFRVLLPRDLAEPAP